MLLSGASSQRLLLLTLVFLSAASGVLLQVPLENSVSLTLTRKYFKKYTSRASDLTMPESDTFLFRNYSGYSSNPAYKAIADMTIAQMYNASNTMIGDHRYFMQDKFAQSKAAGKPWQIFVAGAFFLHIFACRDGSGAFCFCN